MITCPACGTSQTEGTRECRQCQADLSLLVEFDGLAQSFYDQGVRVAKSGENLEAAVRFIEAALALEPEHVEALVVLGKLRAQQQRYQEAMSAWQRALELAPDGSPAREKARAAIARAETLLADQHAATADRTDAAPSEAMGERGARRGRPLVSGIAIAAVLAAGIIAGAFWGRPAAAPVSVSAAVRALKAAVGAHPALKGERVEVTASGGRIEVTGQVSEPLQRDLVEALAGQALARQAAGSARADLSGLRVRPEKAAKALTELLAFLCRGKQGGADEEARAELLAALGDGSVTVDCTDDGGLRIAGSVPTPEAREFVVSAASRLVSPGLVDSSALAVMDEYIEYTVQPGDCLFVIAQRLCGDVRRAGAIREFCAQNSAALQDPRHLRPDTVLRIPKRLLASGR